MRAALELAQQERVALASGQQRDSVEHVVELLAPGEHVVGRLAAGQLVGQGERVAGAGAQDVEG